MAAVVDISAVLSDRSGAGMTELYVKVTVSRGWPGQAPP
jgi:hypothetical protein